MIEARDVTKRFGARQVLRGVNFAAGRGHVTALLGPNGAGKTTFLKMLLGLTRPTTGTLLFDGHPITDDPAYRARVGYMAQLPRFPDRLTGRELISTLRHLRGPRARVDDSLLTAFGLEPHLNQPLSTLSGGTRQKLNALLAFLFRPELLVLDEPTAGLDPVSSGLLKDRILELRGSTTCLVTSHVLSELEELADDVVLLLDGRVRFSGRADDLKRETHQATIARAVAALMRRDAATAAGVAAHAVAPVLAAAAAGGTR
ncbi:MAG TPA: ABC transporter ATP-binding protein [Gemmatimonadaceae bacterium]|jgi:Cu-processing system ATP-binding protein|nr:ABC transporter ATP-binding protein [Gemmatimonadaceae bacterium]